MTTDEQRITAPPSCGESDEVSLLDCYRVIRKHRWMILLVPAVSVVLTAVVSLLSHKIYLATAAIVPPVDTLQKEAGLSSRLGGGTQSLLKGIMDVTGIADMYTGILKSRVVADAMLDRFDLLRVYEWVHTRTDVRKELERNTVIKVGKEGIVQISVKDRDPNRAAAMANAYVEELDRQNKRLSGGQVTSKRAFLETRLQEINGDLSKIDTLPSREAKIKEMLFEMLTEYELAKIEEAKSMPTIQVLDQASPPEKRMGRGTVKKTIVAGFASFFLAIFGAFAYEGVSKLRAEA